MMEKKSRFFAYSLARNATHPAGVARITMKPIVAVGIYWWGASRPKKNAKGFGWRNTHRFVPKMRKPPIFIAFFALATIPAHCNFIPNMIINLSFGARWSTYIFIHGNVVPDIHETPGVVLKCPVG